MKKLIAMLLFVCMTAIAVSAAALSAADLSGMTYEELTELNRLTVLEIMSRPEWKKVEIPAGEWKIGSDIPAGFYSIEFTGYFSTVHVYDASGKIIMLHVMNPGDVYGKCELPEGGTLEIDTPIILAPPVQLGF